MQLCFASDRNDKSIMDWKSALTKQIAKHPLELDKWMI